MSVGASAPAPTYPGRNGPGTLQDAVRQRLAVIKHNDAEEGLTGWNEEGLRVIVRGFISDTESLLRLLDRAADSAGADPTLVEDIGIILDELLNGFVADSLVDQVNEAIVRRVSAVSQPCIACDEVHTGPCSGDHHSGQN